MKGLRIRPEESGLRASLFDLEAELMDVIWTRSLEDFSVGELHRILETRREIAYTTVMTTLGRLCEKELLEREKHGRKYLYRVRMSRSQFVRAMTRDVMNSLPPLGQNEAIAMLVERVSESDDAALDRLEEMIRKQRERRDR